MEQNECSSHKLTSPRRLFACPLNNGVARTLNKIRTSKGDYYTKQRFSPIASLFIMGTSLKEKMLLEGAFVSLKSSSYGIENHVNHIR